MTVAGGTTPPLDYHHATKHAFGRFSRSPGYLDWANQPNPFRRFAGAELLSLPRTPRPSVAMVADLYSGQVPPSAVAVDTIGEFLRCSLGLSAWKVYGASRWALRVNPSSGNLHPTEAYLCWNNRVFHYAPAEHVLEERAFLGDSVGAHAVGLGDDQFLVALTSIPWREAWKYGERAFRYCQHDIGHALGALRMAAAMLGWTMRILPDWPDADTSALLGIDRDDDFAGAEREVPGVMALVSSRFPAATGDISATRLTTAARSAIWRGQANRLSESVVAWPAIDMVTLATEYSGNDSRPVSHAGMRAPAVVADGPSARDIILQRRSATAFDPRGVLRQDVFFAMLGRLRPDYPPCDVQGTLALVHLVVFVHRVQDLAPGIYAYLRSDAGVADEWRAAMRPEFLWERVPDGRSDGHGGLFLLAPLDVRNLARRLSCDQDIAADGFFSLGMLGRLASLAETGGWLYRRLFWECGLIGQVLYLEAEAAGARGTGIGCFYDDPVHAALGLTDDRWQSLYHFSMGLPLDDGRLTTEPGYAWEPNDQ